MSDPIKCGCGADTKRRDGLCNSCWARKWGRERRRYHFSPELLDELRMLYCRPRPAIKKGLDRLQARTGWPRQAFVREARARGWHTHGPFDHWTAEEVEYLRGHLGRVPVRRIAIRLGRSTAAVQRKAQSLELSMRVREGYTLADLGKVFGVHYSRVRSWLDRGLLGKAKGHSQEIRIPDAQVVRFIEQHAWAYDLRRVEQDWFKSMVFARCARS